MLSIICFNLWLALKRPGSWAKGSLKVPSNSSLPCLALLCPALLSPPLLVSSIQFYSAPLGRLDYFFTISMMDSDVMERPDLLNSISYYSIHPHSDKGDV